MEVIRGLHNLRPRHHGCALTIGNFDGIHLGHQAVLGDLQTRAQAASLPTVVMSFEPMPLEFFCRRTAPARLSILREKIEDVAARGMDRLLAVHFDRAFAGCSPRYFIEDLLVRRLGVRMLMVGEDFRFGAERRGDAEMLQGCARRYGFEVVPMPAVLQGGERVSSTRVRRALAAGEPRRAAALLGRAYRMSGRVAAGQRLGRTLGVPTINLPVRRRPAPCYGVYAVRVRLSDGRLLDGAASLGTRPTVNGSGCLLEVHLLGYDGDLYGQRVDVHFQQFLRAEVRFESMSALRAQMLADIEQARAMLAGPTQTESP